MKNLILILIVAAGLSACSKVDENSPLADAEKIANRVIHDTEFELKEVPQKPVLNIQVIDFGKAYPKNESGDAFAFSVIEAKQNEKLDFGISYSEPVTIYVNGKIVFEKKQSTAFQFHEVAYSIFEFNDIFLINLKKGANKIVVKSSLKNHPFIYLREMTGAEEPAKTQFIPVDNSATSFTWPWCYPTGRCF